VRERFTGQLKGATAAWQSMARKQLRKGATGGMKKRPHSNKRKKAVQKSVLKETDSCRKPINTKRANEEGKKKEKGGKRQRSASG